MLEIKIIDKDEIPVNHDIYYGGWSDAELKKYKEDYQARFLGNIEDIRLEVITDYSEPYYIICCAGKSFKNQRQFFIEEAKRIIVINANGNVYRFDIAKKKFLDHSCYKEVFFDNTQNKGNISPYLTTEVSSYRAIMLVIDDEGISAINWNKVLWKRKYDWAYADDLKILEITEKTVVVELDPPDGEREEILINIMSGSVISE